MGEKRRDDQTVGQGVKKGRRQYEIDIFRAWCKSCGICAAFCPVQCIEMDEEGNPQVVASEKCTGCGWCETHCPDFAISVRPRKENQLEAV
ncbi:4Fe-4S dicluster domain-containing protein [Thermodesulforhabdus norvegica]|uniref:2-oxoglutarate ferredoxin oxidoreductase subunit delta n=1 Tax=Thermodesulforhabdus norvegica TaxID=39841 RepID=A0A1I4QF64_9BACT|nr:4Fe-4S dicluster domain-containing protein [Thermodesulforhabdus norvegica]SFM38657.1 2-oxoglutarate ferredoxin oxidoreductase subunit delta [Thermodesulforhabdus norvegica]SFN10850.1 2-oxoglutarate ferredoxin oxidoreductase subunit delta [Thermodesulforhabdus norvegica]